MIALVIVALVAAVGACIFAGMTWRELRQIVRQPRVPARSRPPVRESFRAGASSPVHDGIEGIGPARDQEAAMNAFERVQAERDQFTTTEGA